MTKEEPSEYLLSSGSEQDQGGYVVRIFDGEPIPLAEESDIPSQLPMDVSLVLQQSVNELAKAAPSLQLALKSGRLFELVGPPDKIQGLKDGTLKLMESKGKQLGGIVPKGGGHIQGQAQFNRLTVLATPAVVYQVLSIATSQHYLVTMTQQLDEIIRGIDAIINRTRNEAWGKLLGAQQTVREVAEQLQAAPRETDGAAARLAAAEAHINAVTYEARRNIEEFSTRAERMSSRRLSRKECAELLDDVEGQLAQDIALYREAAQARLFWLRTTLLLDSLTVSEASSLHIKRAATFVEEVSETRSMLAALGERVYRLALESAVPRGALEQLLDAFAISTEVGSNALREGASNIARTAVSGGQRFAEGMGNVAGALGQFAQRFRPSDSTQPAERIEDQAEDQTAPTDQDGFRWPELALRLPPLPQLSLPEMTAESRDLLSRAERLRDRLAPAVQPELPIGKQGLIAYRARMLKSGKIDWQGISYAVEGAG